MAKISAWKIDKHFSFKLGKEQFTTVSPEEVTLWQCKRTFQYFETEEQYKEHLNMLRLNDKFQKKEELRKQKRQEIINRYDNCSGVRSIIDQLNCDIELIHKETRSPLYRGKVKYHLHSYNEIKPSWFSWQLSFVLNVESNLKRWDEKTAPLHYIGLGHNVLAKDKLMCYINLESFKCFEDKILTLKTQAELENKIANLKDNMDMFL